MLPLFEKLIARKQTQAASYRTLVVQAAAGADLDDGESLDLILDAGKSVQDFQTDVDVVRSRHAAVADIVEAQRMERDELPPATEFENQARQDFQAGEEQRKLAHQQELLHLRDTSNAASTIRHRISGLRERAKMALTRSADPSIGAEIRSLRERVESLYSQGNSDRPPQPKIATRSGPERQGADEAQYESERTAHADRCAARKAEIDSANRRIVELEGSILDPTSFTV